MTDRAELHNELERLADVAAAAIEADRGPSVKDRWPQHVWDAVNAITARLETEGFHRDHARHAVMAWLLLRRPGGGRWPVLDCVAATDEHGLRPHTETPMGRGGHSPDK